MPISLFDISIDGSMLVDEKGDHISLADYYQELAQTTFVRGNTDDAMDNLAKIHASSYERSVCRVLRDIHARDTGKAVLKAIQQQESRKMKIRPFFIERYETKGNRFALKLNADASKYPYSAFISTKIPRNLSSKRGLARHREIRSRDTLIRFTPKQWGGRGPVMATGLYRPLNGPGFEADEMLLHEMVHGLRIIAGAGTKRFNRRPVPGQALQENMSEFYAVLIANIYRSECGRDGLRRYYSVLSSETTYTISNEDFLKIELNRRHLRQLRRQNPMLFNALNDVEAPFNPTRKFEDR